MMKTKLQLLAAAAALCLAAGCVGFDSGEGYWPAPVPGLPPSHRPLPPPPVVDVRQAHYPPARRPEPWVSVSITAEEQRIIRDFGRSYTEGPGPGKKRGWKHGELPPGLAKNVERRGSLPPGWQAKIAPGAIMPVEVYQQCHSLPQPLLAQLPPPPQGTVLLAVEGRVVRLVRATLEILDVFAVDL
jgi:hypothetical protein